MPYPPCQRPTPLTTLVTRPPVHLSLSTSSPRSPTSLPVQVAPYTEIIPRLYVSDHATAESLQVYLSLGITHVLSSMNGSVHIPSHPQLRISHLQIPVADLPFAELACHLPRTSQFIHSALADPNARVLVHCAKGISRSPSVVAAYLMYAFCWAPKKALAYVKNKRRGAEPNFGFITQLDEYAEVLKAQGRGEDSRTNY